MSASAKQIAKITGLPEKVVVALQDGGFVSDPPNTQEMFLMNSLREIAQKRNRTIAKYLVSQMNLDVKASIVRTAGLSTLESAIYTRIVLHASDEQSAGVLHVQVVTNEILNDFRLPNECRGMVNNIFRRMRKKFYNTRRRNPELLEAHAGGVPIENIRLKKPARRKKNVETGTSKHTDNKEKYRSIEKANIFDM